MLFNKLQFRKLVNEAFHDLQEYVENLEGCKVERREGYNWFFLEVGPIPCTFGICYDFTNHIMTLTINSLGMVQSLEVEKDVYGQIIQSVYRQLSTCKVNCLLEVQEDYVSDLSFLETEMKVNIYGDEKYVIGHRARQMVNLIKGCLSSPERKELGLPVAETPFDEGKMRVRYQWDEGKVELYYQGNQPILQEWANADKLYCLETEEEVEMYLDEVAVNKREHEQFHKELNAFVRSQNNDYYMEGDSVYVEGELVNVRYKRMIIDDQIAYKVIGFCDEIVVHAYEQIMPFIQEDFHRYIQLMNARQDIREYIQTEDEYSFVITLNPLHMPEWEFYSAILDTRISLVINYCGKEKSYRVQFTDLLLNTTYHRKEARYTRYFESVDELISFVKEDYLNQIKSIRLELLFDPHFVKHYRKLAYVFNLKEWRIGVKLSPALKQRYDLKDLINEAIEMHFSTHSLIPYRTRKCQFEVVGSLYVYKFQDRLYLSQDSEELIKMIMY